MGETLQRKGDPQNLEDFIPAGDPPSSLRFPCNHLTDMWENDLNRLIEWNIQVGAGSMKMPASTEPARQQAAIDLVA